MDKQQPSLEPKYTGPFRVLRRWGKCFRLRLENRDDNVSVDRLRPFYEEDTGRRSQTEQTTNNADIGSAIAEEENKPVNDPEQLPTLGSRSKRTVRPPNRLGFGRIVFNCSAGRNDQLIMYIVIERTVTSGISLLM